MGLGGSPNGLWVGKDAVFCAEAGLTNSSSTSATPANAIDTAVILPAAHRTKNQMLFFTISLCFAVA